jgi:hypothetical protein
MLLGGLWHGASWKFVFWGVLHGLALAVERFFGSFIKLPKNYFVRTIQIFLTFHFVAFCWLFFRAKDFQTAFEIIQNIGNITFNPQQWLIIAQGYQNVFLLITIGFVWHFLPHNFIKLLQKGFDATPLVGKAVVLAFVYWIVYATASAGPQPFIYFQF